jgi:hypothetical protein
LVVDELEGEEFERGSECFFVSGRFVRGGEDE